MNFVTVDEVGEVEEEEVEEEVVTSRTRSQAKKRTRQTPGNTQNYTLITVMSYQILITRQSKLKKDNFLRFIEIGFTVFQWWTPCRFNSVTSRLLIICSFLLMCLLTQLTVFYHSEKINQGEKRGES